MNLEDAHDFIEEHHDDPEALADYYIELHRVKKGIDALKHQIRDLLGNWMHNHHIDWGETDNATFGITNPSPRAKVNEQRWQEAVQKSVVLQALQTEYDNARKPFMEDATQPPRPFVRQK